MSTKDIDIHRLEIITITAFLAVLSFFSHTASAQRTSPGQPSLQISSLINGHAVGAEAYFNLYTLGGAWEAGITIDPHCLELSGYSIEILGAYAQGGYLFRLVSTRRRNLNLYLGGGVLAGMEIPDPVGRLHDYIKTSPEGGTFIYGPYAATSLEYYLTGRFALCLDARIPLVLGSYLREFRWNAGAGIKIVI